MAVSTLYDVDTTDGTTNTSDVLTYSDSSATWGTAPVKIYNGGVDQIRITKTPVHAPSRRVIVKKDFWDGVEWEEHTSYIPRKSITGKIIIGKMHKRWRTPPVEHRGKGLGTYKQFAKTKELFEEKLKGKA